MGDDLPAGTVFSPLQTVSRAPAAQMENIQLMLSWITASNTHLLTGTRYI